MEAGISRNIRVWRVYEDSPGGITITPDRVIAQADKNTFLSVSPGSIGLNANRIAISAQPEHVTKGVLFAENMGFLQTIPSTAATCVPASVLTFPGAGMIGSISQGLGLIAAAQQLPV